MKLEHTQPELLEMLNSIASGTLRERPYLTTPI